MENIYNNNDNVKICVFMWYDTAIKDYAETNYNLNKMYCEKYGYTLIKSEERLCPSKKPHWERLPLMLKYFDEFDYLMWIDADAHFYIDSPPILNVINNHKEKSFIFSGDTDKHKKNSNWVINSGVFIVKKCEKSKLLLNIWLTDDALFSSPELSKPIFGSNKWNDQSVLRLLYSKNIEQIQDNSIIAEYGILQHFNEAHKLPKKIFGLIDKPYIFHCTNGDNMIFKNRVKHSTEYFSNIKFNNYKKYINPNIQLAKNVMKDIIINSENKKLLIFGLGYDSELWYNITNKNTYFVENNQEYINLNKNIDTNNIIYYDYKNIKVRNSLQLNETQISNLPIPKKLLDLAPFDVILVDGPNGFNDDCPGRLLPIYWSKNFLSKNGTIVYIDDVSRNLEKKCVNRYFIDNLKYYFKDRLGTLKIII